MWDGSDGKMSAALVQLSCLYRGMLAVRTTGIRTLIPGQVPVQFRAFSVRKDPDLEENPFYRKYQDKIHKLRSSKPQEYTGRLETRHEAKKEVLGSSKQEEFVRLVEQEVECQPGPPQNPAQNIKTLGSILNLEMIKDKTGEEIAEVSLEFRHKMAAAVNLLSFLYALPQKEGYEFFVGQWSGHELHFTSLINVQTLGENAPSQLILYHYPELKQEKGVVLLTAEMDPKFITVHQAQCLANQVQLFYGAQRQETYRLVETFNHHPADFKHMSVIAELEQSGLGSAVTEKHLEEGSVSGSN
uniref:ATP synthase mitochondrial F1 complex assembly factor 1 n=1 Tax=Kryptolebias marmoratus TaxID=37003 RepID=A0A3Q3BH99_KRYMA